jgi:thioredoxin 1
MAVTQLTEKDFVEAIGGENCSAVLEFYADWCKPCHKMMPMIEKLSEEYKDIKFYKIDADVEFVLVGAFKAATLPTIVFVKDGIVKDVVCGVVEEKLILDCLEKI